MSRMATSEYIGAKRRAYAQADRLSTGRVTAPRDRLSTGRVAAPPMRTKVKRVKSLWRFPHPVPKCLIYVSLLFAVKADGPACSL